MACRSCSTGKDGMPSGCGNKGHCATGGCNKLNTYDWLRAMDVPDPNGAKLAEVSFKGGSRKGFYRTPEPYRYTSGDQVLVDTGMGGYDIGRISLMGDLVVSQMKRKNVHQDRVMYDILRKANPRDLEKLDEARGMEKAALVKSRVIARTLGLDMKVGDVEYQADLKKATFYYTADGWVDFRELVKQYAKEFKVKIEMRQIGARQESARIGGIGACGRELCCSTWLTDFKSVNTSAARYQNIAINQSKLSGQCGRLKCCLNYELDLYVDELDKYPSNVETLYAQNGRASLVKIDIFKGMIYYQYEPHKGRSVVMPLSPEEVRRIKEMNERGEKPQEIVASVSEKADDNKEIEQDFGDVTGAIELPADKKKKKKKKNKNKARPTSAESEKENSGSESGSNQTPNQGQQQRNPQNRQNPNQNPNQQQRNPNQGQQQRNPQNRQNPNQNPNQQQRNPNQQRNNPPAKEGGNEIPKDESTSGEPNQQQRNPNQNKHKHHKHNKHQFKNRNRQNNDSSNSSNDQKGDGPQQDG